MAPVKEHAAAAADPNTPVDVLLSIGFTSEDPQVLILVLGNPRTPAPSRERIHRRLQRLDPTQGLGMQAVINPAEEPDGPGDGSYGDAAWDGPPAGWYPDPAGLPCDRYWDGAKWTDRTRPQTAMNMPPQPYAANDTQHRATALQPASTGAPRSPYTPVPSPPQARPNELRKAKKSDRQILLLVAGVAVLACAALVGLVFMAGAIRGYAASSSGADLNKAPSLSSLTLLQATNRIESGGLPCVMGAAEDVGSFDIVICNLTTSAAFQVAIFEGSLEDRCDSVVAWSPTGNPDVAVGANWYADAFGFHGKSTIKASDIADALGGKVMRMSDLKTAQCRVQ